MKARHLVIAVVLFILLAGSAFAARHPSRLSGSSSSARPRSITPRDLVTDASGNVYVAGTTHGAIDAETQLVPNTNKGGADAFVAKFDPQGALLWVSSSARGPMISSRGSPSTGSASSTSRAGRWGACRAASSSQRPAGERKRRPCGCLRGKDSHRGDDPLDQAVRHGQG